MTDDAEPTAETADDGAVEADDARRARRRLVLERVIVGAVLFVLAAVIVGSHVARQPQISPVDEYVYIDYVMKFPSQGAVRQGEEVGDEARELLVCRGAFVFGTEDPALCGAGDFSDDARFPLWGVTSADTYSPLHPGLTWLGMQLIQLTGIADGLEAMRLVGVLWLWPALWLLYGALRRFGLRPITAAGPTLMLAGSLPALWNSTFVTTDATALLAGSAVLWCCARLLTTGRGAVAFVVVAALATLAKFQNFGAVAVGVLVLLSVAVADARGAPAGDGRGGRVRALLRHPLARTALVAVGAAAVLQAAWLAVRAAIAVGPTPEQFIGRPFSAVDLVLESVRFVFDSASGAQYPEPYGAGAILMSTALAVATVVGSVGATLAPGLDRDLRIVAASTTVLTFTLGPVLALVSLVMWGVYFELPPRYGVVLIPLALAGFAGLVRPRGLSIATCVVGAIMIGLSVFTVTLQ